MKLMSHQPKSLLAMVYVIGMATSAGEVQAQAGNRPSPSPETQQQATANDASGALEDIVVTARKFDEPLQRTPVTVTAFSQEKLDKLTIQQPIDLQNYTPGLQLNQYSFQSNPYGVLGAPSYVIRGQGGGSSNANPAVLAYFAGAPANYGYSLYDMQVVQVLKGPQGTLFGRSAIGGAVLLDPNWDTNKFGGFLDAGTGSRNEIRLSGAMSIPIVDDVLGIRISGYRDHQDGYTQSFNSGQSLNNVNVSSARLGINFTPANWFADRLLFQYEDEESLTGNVLYKGNPALYQGLMGAVPGVCSAAATSSGLPGNASFIAGCTAQRDGILSGIIDEFSNAQTRFATGDHSVGIRTIGQGPPAEIFRTYSLINQTDLHIPDVGPITDITLKNTYSKLLNRYVIQNGFDAAGTDLGITSIFSGVRQFPNGVCATSGPNIGQCTQGLFQSENTPTPNQGSNEVNLSFDLFGRLKILAGDFYEWSSNDQVVAPTAVQLFGLALSPLMSALATNSPSPNATNTLNSDVWEKGDYINTTLDLKDLVDGLSLSGGYRYNTTYSENTTQLVTGGPVTVSALPGSGYNYSFSANYQVTQSLLLYVVRSRAFRPGGLNPSSCSVLPLDAGGCPASYAPEVLIDTEGGIKWDWHLGDIQARTNGAVYHYNDSNEARSFVSPVADLIYTLANTQSVTNGFELEQTVVWKNLSVDVDYNYLDAHYTKWFAQQGAAFPCTDPINNSGNNCADYKSLAFLGAPRNQLSVTAQYSVPVQELGEFVPSLTVASRSSVNFADVPATDPGAVQGQYTLLNARVAWNHIMNNRAVSAEFFVRNLTNKFYFQGMSSLLTSLGYQSYSQGEPRTAGVELRYTF
jgi:iron complex outermembrane recepter protein